MVVIPFALFVLFAVVGNATVVPKGTPVYVLIAAYLHVCFSGIGDGRHLYFACLDDRGTTIPFEQGTLILTDCIKCAFCYLLPRFSKT